MSSIPASQIVQVNPSVLSAGGSALALNGLFLSEDTATPIGAVRNYATADDVGAFYGLTSPEYLMAQVYFNGFDNSTKKPGRLLIAQYNAAAVAAYLRGGSVAGMSLTELQGLTPSTIALTIDGVLVTSASVNLAGATSFSNAATIIQTAFGVDATVTYDAQRNAFKIASTTTGAASTITFATASTMATGLKLTSTTGGVLSQGAAVATPSTTMDTVKNVTQNWAAFTTLFEPLLADKIAFSAWTNAQNNRYAYAGWDSDPNAIIPSGAGTWMEAVETNTYSGTIAMYLSRDKAVFVLGFIASLDFERLNGRATLAFKSQSGLAADVTDATTAQTLIDNGYNFYGAYATANDDFVFAYDGQVSGPFQWVDTYVNQIQLNNALQLAMMNLLVSVNSLPYNQDGYNMVRAACMDPINAALNFGSIREGITLSNAQAAAVNNAAGVDIAQTLQQRGWYLQILDAAPITRQARQSPPMTLWYLDGGSIQKLVLASIVLQ